jgi:coenzyme F420 hydrogenase subunit beta
MRKNVESIIKNEVCTRCGACAVLCPKEAIKLVIDRKRGIYLPEIDRNKCNDCGICRKVCPRYEFDFEKLNLEIFGKKVEDVLLGNYLDCYTGHATDYNIRYNASSGGLITTLLVFALQKEIINGALVIRMKEDKPLESESFIARTPEAIILAKGSKYCPVSISQSLKEIMNSEEKEKFAVVGQPCHIQGVRKIEEINNNLKRKIVLHLGLFCNHTPNFYATQILLKKLKIKKEEVIKLDYRGGGWPGYMKIQKSDGEILIPSQNYWNFLGSDFFSPLSCFLCSDHTSELADISFGDAWLPEFREDKIGTSLIIVRTPQGREILEKANQAGLIQINSIIAKKVILSQLVQLYHKKKSIGARTKLLKKKIHFANTLKPDLIDFLLSLFSWFSIKLSEKSFFREIILPNLPFSLLSNYNRIINFFYSKRAKDSFKNYIGNQKLKNEVSLFKKPKIVITNHGHRLNKGSSALLHSRIKALKKIIPDIQFSVFTYHPEIESDINDPNVKFLEIIGKFSRRNFLRNLKTLFTIIKCSLWYFLFKYFHFDLKQLRKDKGLEEYYNADVIISTGGDVLTEDYGTPINPVTNLLFGIFLHKPVIIYAESIGPFRHWYNKVLVKFLLNRVKLITLREEISKRYLEELKIKDVPIYTTADSSFLLEPVSLEKVKEIFRKEGIQKNNSLMGISVSKLFSRYEFPNLGFLKDRYQNYIKLMAQITDYLIKTYRASVIFIPHVIEPPRNDDRDVAEEVINLIKNKEKTLSIKNEYTPEEIRGIIGQCDLFIGARMHACIASTSMKIPTIAIAYSHKTEGIIGEMLGQKKYVLDFKTLNFDDLKSAIDDAWQNRKKIREELETRVNSIKKYILWNAELIKKIIYREI